MVFIFMTFTICYAQGSLVYLCRMKVLDLGTGEQMGAGETGELCFQGPQVKIVAVLI